MKIPGTTCRKSVSTRDYSVTKDINLVCEGGRSVVARPQRRYECNNRNKAKKSRDEKIGESHDATCSPGRRRTVRRLRSGLRRGR